MDDSADFDRLHERKEEDEDVKFAAKLVAEELNSLKAQRACIFISDSEEVLHGRITGVLSEMDFIVLRDLRPTRQMLRAKLLVPSDRIEHICVNEDPTKCKTCYIYEQIVSAMKEPEEDAKKQDESKPVVRDSLGASGADPADKVGSASGAPAS
jgi:hypothetical protein